MSSITSNAAAANAALLNKSQKDLDSLVGTREDFLTILLAQLKHQDPLEPMKGTEFIDSITRLSSVEQAVNQNSHLEKIESLLGNSSSRLGSPVSYLDKNIEFTSSSFNLANGVGEFSYDLTGTSEPVSIVIKNAEGVPIYTGSGTQKLGRNDIAWDGKDKSGNPVRAGEYTVEVNLIATNGIKKAVSTYTSGTVTGASFADGDTSLWIGNIKTSLDNVLSVTSTGTAS